MTRSVLRLTLETTRPPWLSTSAPASSRVYRSSAPVMTTLRPAKAPSAAGSSAAAGSAASCRPRPLPQLAEQGPGGLLVEEVPHRARDHRADLLDLLQLLHGRLLQSFHRREAGGQGAGHGAAHVQDPEGEEEAVEGAPAALVQGVDEVLRRLLGESFQARQGLHVEAVEVAHVGDQLLLHELLHHGRAEPLDVHGVAAAEVLEPALPLALAGGVDAAGRDLLLVAHQAGPAGRAVLGEPELLGLRRPLFLHDADHLGDHVAALLDHHQVADADVLALDLVGVVEGGALHRGARHRHRIEDGHRRDRPGAAHLQADLEEPGADLLGGELEGHGAARALAGAAEPLLLIEGVHLEHDAVHLVRQLVAGGLAAVVEGEDLFQAGAEGMLRVDRKAEAPEGVEALLVGAAAVSGQVDPVGEEPKPPAGHDLRVLQLEGPRRRVAGVGEERPPAPPAGAG